VSTFGHGVHSCPGQRFALDVAKIVTTLYFRRLALMPQFTRVGIPPTSVGAIGRADGPCIVSFTKRPE
jgi:cytochrome P450